MHPHRSLRILGGTLTAFVAGIHLFHPQYGIRRFLVHLQIGQLLDPRPLLFTFSALALLVGIGLASSGLHLRYLYLGGIAIVGTYFAGFFIWHTLLDHGAFWPHIRPHGHTESVAEFVSVHLISEPDALISKVAELLLLVVLGLLYRIDVMGASDESTDSTGGTTAETEAGTQ